uniref:Chitin-binding type-2 domain-containing protein n=1 Tax=Romanomermis culicivorax TaxID=13658 RepID=A0A915HXC6_ROMCU
MKVKGKQDEKILIRGQQKNRFLMENVSSANDDRIGHDSNRDLRDRNEIRILNPRLCRCPDFIESNFASIFAAMKFVIFALVFCCALQYSTAEDKPAMKPTDVLSDPHNPVYKGDQCIVDLKPHPSDCHKFLNCDVEMDCGPMTVFDPQELVCAHEEDAVKNGAKC